MKTLRDKYESLVEDVRVKYYQLLSAYKEITVISNDNELEDEETIIQIINSEGDTLDVVLIKMDKHGLFVCEYNDKDFDNAYYVGLSDIFDIQDRIKVVELLTQSL